MTRKEKIEYLKALLKNGVKKRTGFKDLPVWMTGDGGKTWELLGSDPKVIRTGAQMEAARRKAGIKPEDIISFL